MSEPDKSASPDKHSQPVTLMPMELSMLVAWHRAREQESVKTKQYRAAEYHLRRAEMLDAAAKPLPVVEPEVGATVETAKPVATEE